MKPTPAILIVLFALLVGAALLASRPDAPVPVVEPLPAPVVAPPSAPAPAPRDTTPPATPTLVIAVLTVLADSVELVDFVDKTVPFVASPEAGDTRWRVEDLDTGKMLASGTCVLPAVCECPKKKDHARGCAIVRHRGVMRLAVPRFTAKQRLVISDAERELGRFELGGRP